MRLAAQSKAGFYPAHPEAIAAILEHLQLNTDKPDEVCIIDPCAGEGLAIGQIASGLGVSPDRVYAIELDAGRAEKCRENLPGANILGPASFRGTLITGYSFGLAYVNPPFDYQAAYYGSGREEHAFVERATGLLMTGGVLVLIAPFGAVFGQRDFIRYLDGHYSDIRLFAFPEGVRPYNELVVIGRKRKETIPRERIESHGSLHMMEVQWRTYTNIDQVSIVGQPYAPLRGGYRLQSRAEPEVYRYTVPWSWKPHKFDKTRLTDEEMVKLLADSPLNRLLQDVPVLPRKRPPLPLDKGHVALLLASGMLDGLVEDPVHGNHVVRGTSRKVEYHNKEQSSSHADPETGAVTTKDVFSQRVVLSIRTVSSDGEIRTFSDEPEKQEDDSELEL